MAYNEQELLPIDQVKTELHRLCAANKSGDLCLFTEDKHAAVISLHEGEIVGLRYRIARGNEALTHIKNIRKAKITFKNVASGVNQTVTTNIPGTSEILKTLGVAIATDSSQGAAAKKKVLVVEDSRTQRIIICRMLKQNGYETIEAGDGYEAMEQLEKVKPDLVLLDIVMPGIDGYKVMSLIKDKPGMKNIPIIMLTSRDNLIDKMRGKVSGTNEYLTKPFVYEELISKVDKYLFPLDRDVSKNNSLIA